MKPNKELIVVTSRNCAPCKALKNRLNLDGIPFKEVDSLDVDFDKFQIMSVPVLFFMENDIELDRMDGFCIPDYMRITQTFITSQ